MGPLVFPKSAAQPLERQRLIKMAKQVIWWPLTQSKDWRWRVPAAFSGNWLIIVNPKLFDRKICFRTTFSHFFGLRGNFT
jgi:hypothetical protein